MRNLPEGVVPDPGSLDSFRPDKKFVKHPGTRPAGQAPETGAQYQREIDLSLWEIMQNRETPAKERIEAAKILDRRYPRGVGGDGKAEESAIGNETLEKALAGYGVKGKPWLEDVTGSLRDKLMPEEQSRPDLSEIASEAVPEVEAEVEPEVAPDGTQVKLKPIEGDATSRLNQETWWKEGAAE